MSPESLILHTEKWRKFLIQIDLISKPVIIDQKDFTHFKCYKIEYIWQQHFGYYGIHLTQVKLWFIFHEEFDHIFALENENILDSSKFYSRLAWDNDSNLYERALKEINKYL